MTRWRSILTTLILGTALLASGTVCAVELPGSGPLPVVYSVSSQQYDEEAARELATYIGRVTSQSVPVVEGSIDGAAIRVGQAALDAQIIEESDLAGWSFDGFLVRVNDRGIGLCGRNPHGTLYAAYRFIQRYLGVRWYMPGELGEVVPDRDQIEIPAGDWRLEPEFVPRQFAYMNSVPRGEVWARRNGLSWGVPGLPFRSRGFHHNLSEVLKPSEYGDAHPEYFPLIDGERFVPASDKAHNWQPCTSNPAVVEIFAQAAINYFGEHPKEQMFALGMNDSGRFCECPDCRALDPERPRGRKNRYITTDRYVHFVNAVARRLHEKHPDRFVGFLAYRNTAPAPIREEVEDTVYVVIT